jgi:hypothetical protein
MMMETRNVHSEGVEGGELESIRIVNHDEAMQVNAMVAMGEVCGANSDDRAKRNRNRVRE